MGNGFNFYSAAGWRLIVVVTACLALVLPAAAADNDQLKNPEKYMPKDKQHLRVTHDFPPVKKIPIPRKEIKPGTDVQICDFCHIQRSPDSKIPDSR